MSTGNGAASVMAGVAAALALGTAGCRGAGTAGAGGPGFTVLESRPAEATLAAADLCPTAGGRREFRITSGDDAGALLVERRLATPAQSATWIDDPRGERREFWRIAESGDVIMPAVIDVADGAITIFDPPLVIAPASLEPGPPRSQQTSMRVMRLDDPSQVRESGTAVQTIEYSDVARIRTAEGEFDAARVTITFKADLRMADAQTVTTIYAAPGRGPVVREWSESVKALGLTIRSTRRTMIREKVPPPAASTRWIDSGLVGLGSVGAIVALAGALANPLEGMVLLFTCYFLLGFAGCGLLLYLGAGSRWLAYPGVIASIIGLSATFWPRTASLLENEPFLSLTFFGTAFCTYSGVMHAVAREGRNTALLRWPATARSAVLCVGLAMTLGRAPEWIERTTGVAAALAAGLALAVIPIRVWEKRRRETQLETTGATVALTCPRCAETQEIRAGRRRCRKCRLVIALDVEEPCCAGCGFALYRLTAGRCPECGLAIPPDEQWRSAA